MYSGAYSPYYSSAYNGAYSPYYSSAYAPTTRTRRTTPTRRTLPITGRPTTMAPRTTAMGRAMGRTMAPSPGPAPSGTTIELCKHPALFLPYALRSLTYDGNATTA